MSTGHGALVSLTAALCALAVPLGTSAQDLGKRAEGAEAACDTIAAIVKAVPGAKVVRKGDTTTSSDGRQIRAGCQVIVTGTFKALGANWMNPPQILINKGLSARGWNEDFSQQADGPNGGEFTVRRASVSCKVSARWEEAPDSRPTQPVSDEYTVEAVCAPVS
ncbi:MAG: hypothetical protein E6H44_14985 [Betaproteobacteria bacterium]|nr:MAG: hypothetical protein E6H44_14985 [Betaproteobacteria bacterium]